MEEKSVPFMGISCRVAVGQKGVNLTLRKCSRPCAQGLLCSLLNLDSGAFLIRTVYHAPSH
jgi:hypothetical protein